jgi:hypothetical protein
MEYPDRPESCEASPHPAEVFVRQRVTLAADAEEREQDLPAEGFDGDGIAAQRE